MIKLFLTIKKFLSKCLFNIKFDNTHKDLQDIPIVPLDNKTIISSEIKVICRQIIEKYGLLNNLIGYKKYLIRISDHIPTNMLTYQAYNIWTENFFGKIETPFNLPRQNTFSLCSTKLILIRIECINYYTDSYRSCGWGFAGYILHILVDIEKSEIWDARGEKSF